MMRICENPSFPISQHPFSHQQTALEMLLQLTPQSPPPPPVVYAFELLANKH